MIINKIKFEDYLLQGGTLENIKQFKGQLWGFLKNKVVLISDYNEE